ncbi:hypothetical protein [Devosia sp.]|uniref:hypothetical protein n=1 Tax=Devosia sp. TaxID=1871048 RepID=UPI003A9557F9
MALPAKLNSIPQVKRRRKLRIAALTSATAISFSLTFVLAGVALLFGLAPSPEVMFGGKVDTAVLLLFVPLCALTLAMLVEVSRTIVRGIPEVGTRAAAREWHPGSGEG